MAVDKNTVVKEAQKFSAKGQFDKAVQEWRKLLKEYPSDSTIFNTIGDLCLKKGDAKGKAEAVEAYYRAGTILAAEGFSSKAIAVFKKVLNIDPNKTEVHLALGDMNAEKGLIGNALESYKVAADHYSKNKETDKALGIYQKMADLNPSNTSFKLKLADMYVKSNMNEQAVKTYLEIADVHMSKEAFQDARQVFEKALALDPKNKEIYHKAGIIYFKEGKYVEACKSLKPAFESDPSNRELADLYLDALSKAGRDAEAEELYKKILAEDPDRIDLREKLFRIYLARKEHDKALAEAAIIAEVRLKNRDAAGEEGQKLLPGSGDAEMDEGANAALNDLIGMVAEIPDYVEARQTLSDFYIKVGRGVDAARELVRVAEIRVENGDENEAKAALAKALELVPEMPEAVQLMDRLQPPPEPVAAEEPEAVELMDRPQPPPSPETVVAEKPAPAAPPPSMSAAAEEDPAIAEAITEADVLVKYGLSAKALEQLEGLAGKFPESPLVREKLCDLYRDQGNMTKAAAHMLVLSDIYAKKGMADQADLVLRAVQEIDPGNAEIQARMGSAPAASEFETGAISSAELGGDFGVPEPPEDIVLAPEENVPELETGFEATALDLGEEPGILEEPAEPGSMAEEALPDLDTGFETTPMGPGEEPGSPEESFETGSTAEEALPDLETGFELPPMASGEEPGISDFSAEDSVVALENGADSPADAGEIPFEEPLAATGSAEEQPPAPEERELETPAPASEREPEAPPKSAPPPKEADIGELWSEAEFYYQQGLFDEAKKHYAKIIQLDPGETRAIERLGEISREAEETQAFSKLAEAVDGLERQAAGSAALGEEMATSSSDEEAVRSLMQEIAQLSPQSAGPKKGEAAAPPAPAADKPSEDSFIDLGEELRGSPPAPSPAKGKERETKESDDYFDLASELRDELSNVAIPPSSSAPEEEQSLDDIFEEFKKGVDQQAVREDVDTHYNLGVAYKEMGLLDDAIAEFILTPEAEPKFVQSRYMLGLCYMEKGEYHDAITQIQNALKFSESFGNPVKDRVGMHYDLGLAYQGAEDASSALKEFQKVCKEDPEYRDAASKTKELQKGDFISLEQLKDDIEREISFKFIAEGERIEREEKIRKNEKVRS